MNYARLALAAFASFAAYMVLGGLIFGAIPSLKEEFLKYPNVYRSQQGQMSHMPTGMAAMLLSIIVLVVVRETFQERFRGCGRCGFRGIDRTFCDWLVCAAQLCQPQHWFKDNRGVRDSLLRRMDGLWYCNRAHIQARKLTLGPLKFDGRVCCIKDPFVKQ